MIPLFSYAAEENAPKRTINLVYDDSGSMIVSEDGKKVDTWCQAKYSMEVFAAMLSENDTMNVYYMSDFENSTSGGPKLVLNGNDEPRDNIKKVHNLVTNAGNTPFNAVRKAEADLEKVKADEKWLVVLTDGEFEDGAMKQSEIDDFFAQKPSDIKVMYLGMGANAGAITQKDDKEIFYVKAKDNSEILRKLTEIGTQVFNRDRLDINAGKSSISFDVPMNELIVFAQGENVSINGIKGKSGELIKSIKDPVSVQYSEEAAKNFTDIIIDKSLRGSIATFQEKFTEGDYILDVSGAKTIEVYYKPDVEIAAYLNKGDEEVTDLSDLEAGDYTIDFALVKGGTDEKIKSSKLLGEVQFEAEVTNNDKKHEKSYTAGDTITIEEGPLTIDATAHYLGYHTVNTHLDYSIYKDKTIGFEELDNPAHVITSKGIKSDKPMKVRVTVDGKEPTDEQWNEMDIPSATLAKKTKAELGDIRIEKAEEKGVYNLYPAMRKKPVGKEYKDAEIKLSYNGKVGSETWAGADNVLMKISDERSWLVKNRDLVIRLLLLLLLLIILLGYTPIKKRLPRSIKKKAVVKCRHDDEDPYEQHAKYEKSKIRSLLPYVSETATARIASKKFNLKGMRGGRRVILTNANALASKDIKINNKRIKDYGKTVEFGPGSEIVIIDDDGWKYTCQLTVEDRKAKRRNSKSNSKGRKGKRK